MAREKILVTGGAGFIGSHIADALIAKKYQVRIIDNFSTGSLMNIEQLEGKVEVLNGSIVDKNLLEVAVEGIDYIFHEAAQTSVVDSIKNPVKTWDTNIKGTKLILNAAVKNKVKKIVIASSANIYGNDATVPKNERMNVKPTSPYGESKIMDELMAKKYYETDGLRTTCLRYFNVYGPRQNPKSEYSGVISKFLDMMANGKTPTVFGDGKQTRDFIYVEDVVTANLLAIGSNNTDGEVLNVATGMETSINDLINTVNEILDTTIKPTYAPERLGDIRRSVADISKAKKLLGFEPKYRLKDGLKKTIEWFRGSK